MRANLLSSLAHLVLLLCAVKTYAATTAPAPISSTPASVVIQLFPESNSLDLNSGDRTSTEREASTLVRVSSTGTGISFMHRIQVFACVAQDDAMRTAGKTSTLDAVNLRVKNDRGEWTEMEPLPQLRGRRGVLVAIVTSTSATFLLQVQLHVPAGQRPGDYQGVLTVEAQEQ